MASAYEGRSISSESRYNRPKMHCQWNVRYRTPVVAASAIAASSCNRIRACSVCDLLQVSDGSFCRSLGGKHVRIRAWRTDRRSLGNQCSCQWTDWLHGELSWVESVALRDWITRFADDDRSISDWVPGPVASLTLADRGRSGPPSRPGRPAAVRATIAHRITSNLDRSTLLIHARNACVYRDIANQHSETVQSSDEPHIPRHNHRDIASLFMCMAVRSSTSCKRLDMVTRYSLLQTRWTFRIIRSITTSTFTICHKRRNWLAVSGLKGRVIVN